MILVVALPWIHVGAWASQTADEAQPLLLPKYRGDADAAQHLHPWLDSAYASTAAYGPWPAGAWTVYLHETDASFESATGSPGERHALWIGSVLHLRPWARLARRDLGALLRHELTHRRVLGQGMRLWREEALCLWAEGHVRPPDPWPEAPDEAMQARLDTALRAGTTARQRWAYAWLRAWLGRRTLPEEPRSRPPEPSDWLPEKDAVTLRVVWPPERLPRSLQVQGVAHPWRRSARYHYEGVIRFGAGLPVSSLEGSVDLEAVSQGWQMTWTTHPEAWLAAVVEGELGAEAPYEAKRALGAVLAAWLEAHPNGNHGDGALCPLTHCAVVRGRGGDETLRAVRQGAAVRVPPDRAYFTGSTGGETLSPRDAWGGGSPVAGQQAPVPGDPWATWTRRLSAAQVRALKGAVRPGVAPGQRGLKLGLSGPYPVESLRLAAGRRFGWTLWPSNACTAEVLPDGSVRLQGKGWGHNVGLCLASALHRARQGDSAETILAAAFPEP